PAARRRRSCFGSSRKRLADSPFPTIRHVLQMEGASEHRTLAIERRAREEGAFAHVDVDRLRMPLPPNALDAHDGMGFFFVVESERKRPREPQRLPKIRKRGIRGQWRGLARKVRDDVQIRLSTGLDPHLQAAALLEDLRVTLDVVIMSERVAGEHHQLAVRIAAQNAETPKRPAGRRSETRENVVAGEKEILSQGRR